MEESLEDGTAYEKVAPLKGSQSYEDNYEPMGLQAFLVEQQAPSASNGYQALSLTTLEKQARAPYQDLTYK